jgi:hypothetical protein
VEPEKLFPGIQACRVVRSNEGHPERLTEVSDVFSLSNKIIDFFNQHHYVARFTSQAGAGLYEQTYGG